MTTLITADRTSNVVAEQETLADGTVVWVARDLELDGCIAQAPSYPEVLAALEVARREYTAVLAELKQSRAEAAPVHAVTGWTRNSPVLSHTFTA